MSPEEIADAPQQTVQRHRRVPHRRSNTDLMVMRREARTSRGRRTSPASTARLGLGYWEPRVEGCQLEALKPEEVSEDCPPGIFHQLLGGRGRAGNAL